MKITVLMGGVSEEREVSLQSGIQVVDALRSLDHEVVAFDTSHGTMGPDEEEALRGAGIKDPPPPAHSGDLLLTGDTGTLAKDPGVSGSDVIFVALHGGGGEDGTVQTLLDLAGIPYAGSDRMGCALAMDKDLSKRLLRFAGVPTPDWIVTRGRVEGEARLPEILEILGLPLIVKPPSGGSTLGLTLVHREEELGPALDLALAYEDAVLFERYVRGRELTVGILGLEALPVGEIIPQHELFDYDCKYKPGMAQEIFPADLPEAVANAVQSAALLSHGALGLRDYSRIDFILDEAGVPWCLEANALPGLTANSLLPKAAAAAGMDFPTLCHRIAGMGRARARAHGTAPA